MPPEELHAIAETLEDHTQLLRNLASQVDLLALLLDRQGEILKSRGPWITSIETRVTELDKQIAELKAHIS